MRSRSGLGRRGGGDDIEVVEKEKAVFDGEGGYGGEVLLQSELNAAQIFLFKE